MGELNLIPYELRNEKNNGNLPQLSIIITVVAIVLLAFLYVGPKIYLIQLNSYKNELNSRSIAYKKTISENTKLLSEINDIKVFTSNYDTLTKNKIAVGDILKDLQKTVPSSVVFKSISYGKNQISISAQSKDYSALCEFDASLQLSSRFKASVIQSITSDQSSGGYTLNISIALPGGAVDEKSK